MAGKTGALVRVPGDFKGFLGVKGSGLEWELVSGMVGVGWL